MRTTTAQSHTTLRPRQSDCQDSRPDRPYLPGHISNARAMCYAELRREVGSLSTNILLRIRASSRMSRRAAPCPKRERRLLESGNAVRSTLASITVYSKSKPSSHVLATMPVCHHPAFQRLLRVLTSASMGAALADMPGPVHVHSTVNGQQCPASFRTRRTRPHVPVLGRLGKTQTATPFQSLLSRSRSVPTSRWLHPSVTRWWNQRPGLARPVPLTARHIGGNSEGQVGTLPGRC